MRPVNLLPEKLRPRDRKSGGSGAYIVLGVLGALLVATVMYVVTTNQVTSQKAETQELKAETQAAEQRAGALAQFGDFQEMKATRMASVALLAAGRFDWERMSRELARVLPAGVWLTDLTATATGEEAESSGSGSGSGSSSSSSSSTSTSAGAAGEQPGPSIKMTGCSPTQEGVAETMVRLRRLHQAEDVQLVRSERGEDVAAPAAPSGPSPSGGAATAPEPAGPEGCGSKRGRQNYKFEITVKLLPTPDPTVGGGSVPRSLGGGS